MIIGAGNEDIHLEPLWSPHSWCCVSKDTFWAKLNWMNGIRFSVLSVKSGCKLSFKFVCSVLQGWLTVTNSTPDHSGNYSCVPSYTTPDWVIVHIIKGKLFEQRPTSPSFSDSLFPVKKIASKSVETLIYKIKTINKWISFGGSPKIFDSFIDSEDYCFRWESC